jgi:hypothetical protein
MKGLLRLDEVKPEHHNWIWADRIARTEIHFLAGKPDVGKGMMCAKIAADVSWGRDAFTGKLGPLSTANPKQPPLKPMNVLYSAAEDGPGTMTRPRLEVQGAKVDNIHLKRFRLPADFAELADIVVDKEIDLIILDPLASHLSGGVNRYGDSIRLVTDPLKELLEATGAAALVVDHVRKHVAMGSDPLNAVGGASSGFPAACRMGFLFGPNPTDEENAVLGCVKHNIRDKPMAMLFEIDSVEASFDWTDTDTGEVMTWESESVPKLVTQGEDYFNPIRLVAGERSQVGRGRPADKRAQACEWLTTYLWLALQKGGKAYPVLGKQVQEDALQFGMSYRTLRRAADEMKIIKSGKGGSGVTWKLPTEIVDMLTGEVEESSSGPEIAAKPVEEKALEQMLDQGTNPSGDDKDWERNKPATDGQGDAEPSAEFDAQFDDFLKGLDGNE